MNSSGDVAEQMMRMSLEGVEVAVKLSGAGAMKLAQVIYRVLKEQEKTKGKARLSSMLRSGHALKVYTVPDEQLKRFSEEAKRYGVLYCILKDKDSKDGVVDVMVRAEDASKINRIVNRFKIATVDSASIKTKVETDRENAQKSNVEDEKTKSKEDKILDAIMKKPKNEEREGDNPFLERTEGSNQSRSILNGQKDFVSDNLIMQSKKSSVREEIKKIENRRRNEHKVSTLEKGEIKIPQKSNIEKER